MIPASIGELPPGVAPDYQGGGILNLVASLIQARGGWAEPPTLDLLPAASLAGATNLVLVVIDGLGDGWLARHSPGGLLSRHRLGAITSVFPSTTASAITTYLTGDAPLRHGLTGWHTWMGELACVMTVLPGTPRYGGASYRTAGIDPVRLFGGRSLFGRIRAPSWMLTPAHIARSDFNLAHAGAAQVLGYQGLRDLIRQTTRLLRRNREPKYVYIYWPELDSIGHRSGMESQAAAQHLEVLESALRELLDRTAGTNTLLLVCADHGQVDLGPGDLIDLADHPGLESCLALPLCGEGRAAFAYLKAGRESAFLDYCAGPLAGQVEVRPSGLLRDAGYFGVGVAHPRFAERIGDYCLLPTGSRLIRQRLPFEERHDLIGQHGGLSESEMLVPLCLIRA
ncbi:MAG: alkaline phosphatase family protein [Bdellovibrio bacteriovorus]